MSAAVTEHPISKAEFARRRGVSRVRVGQWVGEKKIVPPALVGQGRDQKIIESIACEQLKSRLDINQRFGSNGLSTRIDAPARSAEQRPTELPPPATSAPIAKPDAIEDKIKAEKLEQIQRANRREAIEEAAKSGRLTDAAQAAQQMGRIAAQMVTVFEAALGEFAGAISAKHQLPQRDVLHLLRSEFRKVRASVATTMQRQAEEMPGMIAVEMETPVEASQSQPTHDDPDNECGTVGDGSAGAGLGPPAAG